MPRKYGKIVAGLFLSLIIGCGTFSIFLISFPGYLDLEEEFERARKFYLEGDYLDSLLILAALEKQVQANESVEYKNEILSEIHFLSGLCFLEGWNKTDRGKDSFQKALKYNPSFRVSEELYGQKAVQLFQDLMKDDLTEATEESLETEDSEEKDSGQFTGEPSREETSVRIVKKNAVLRIKPSNSGSILKSLPLGALLEVEEALEGWLKIKLPPDKDGFIMMGYIQRSFIEDSSVIHQK
jgi:hypothetical protein